MSHHDTFHDDGPPISQLQAAIKSLDDYVRAVLPQQPPVLDPTSVSSPKSSDPAPNNYASPTPVQQFARQDIVSRRWKDIGKSHVAVCGVGGMGSVVADALVRAGVGRLLLVDQEQVRWSCLGRAGFYPEEVGFSRAQALRLRLQSVRVRSDAASVLNVESLSVDWRSDADLAELRKKLKASCVGGLELSPIRPPQGDEDTEYENDNLATTTPGLGLFEALTQRRPYDAVVSCLEDDPDRLALNQICLELSLPLLHAVLSPCSSTVSIRTILPGHTCCCECVEVADSTQGGELTQSQSNPLDQVARSIAKALPASLPHVEILAGGLLGQHTLKFLLEAGDFVPFFSVNTQTFEIESFSFPPNRSCTNNTCRKRQDEERHT